MPPERRILGTELKTGTSEKALKELTNFYKPVIPGTLEEAALKDLYHLHDKRATFAEIRNVYGDDFPGKNDLLEEIFTIDSTILHLRAEKPDYKAASLITASITRELNAHYRNPEKHIDNPTRQISLDLQEVQKLVEGKIRSIPSQSVVFAVRELPTRS